MNLQAHNHLDLTGKHAEIHRSCQCAAICISSPFELRPFFRMFLKLMSTKSLAQLEKTITSCRLCPRLVEWREEVARVKAPRFSGDKYWGKPVHGFGDPQAQLLIFGLAPAAHGANRTGRMFTGDRSGEWLYRALYTSGFANQPGSVSVDDKLKLRNCYITASVRCAPPGNKPLPEESRNCRPYLLAEYRLLTRVRVILGLGKIAFDTAFDTIKELNETSLTKRPKFAHGAEARLNDRTILLGSYHPSQQNTFTGKLTVKMFDEIFRKVVSHL